MKVVFLGTPQIAVSSLEFLIKKEDVELQAVITQPDKPAGRGQKLCFPPVKCVAQKHGIPVYQPTSIKKDSELINTLKNLEPDFFVTFAFGQLLSQEVLDIPRHGCINLHASLLPEYRGANPIQAAIINGEEKTGITAMLTELALDSGPIVMQQEIKLTENMVTGDLCGIIEQISPDFIYRSLKGLETGVIKPVPQNDELATYTPKLKKEDGLINWSEPARVIHNKVRGLRPWPGAFTYMHDTCVKITQSRLPQGKEADKSGSPGQILGKAKDGIKVSTGDGIIVITRLQPACKKEQDAVSWYNGARLEPGEGFVSDQREDACSCEL